MKLSELAVNDYFWVPSRADSFRVYAYLGKGFSQWVGGNYVYEFPLDTEVGLAQWLDGCWEQLPLENASPTAPQPQSWRDRPPLL